jgi:hypothetical protein
VRPPPIPIAMTSEVKRSAATVLTSSCRVVAIVHRKSRSQSETTVEPAAIRGVVTTGLVAVGCRPQSRDEKTRRPLHAVEGDTRPGRRRGRSTLATFCAVGAMPRGPVGRRLSRAPVSPGPP